MIVVVRIRTDKTVAFTFFLISAHMGWVKNSETSEILQISGSFSIQFETLSLLFHMINCVERYTKHRTHFLIYIYIIRINTYIHIY